MDTHTDTHTQEAKEILEPVEEKPQRAFRWARQLKQRKSWKDMSATQKGINIILAIAEFILTGWALWDIKHRSVAEINGKKRTWVMTSLIQPFGPVIYLLFGRKRGNAPVPA